MDKVTWSQDVEPCGCRLHIYTLRRQSGAMPPIVVAERVVLGVRCESGHWLNVWLETESPEVVANPISPAVTRLPTGRMNEQMVQDLFKAYAEAPEGLGDTDLRSIPCIEGVEVMRLRLANMWKIDIRRVEVVPAGEGYVNVKLHGGRMP